MKTYKCIKCESIWEFIPKDYNYKKTLYPTKCPLCSMPFSQFVREMLLNKFPIKEIVNRIVKRLV